MLILNIRLVQSFDYGEQMYEQWTLSHIIFIIVWHFWCCVVCLTTQRLSQDSKISISIDFPKAKKYLKAFHSFFRSSKLSLKKTGRLFPTLTQSFNFLGFTKHWIPACNLHSRQWCMHIKIKSPQGWGLKRLTLIHTWLYFPR